MLTEMRAQKAWQLAVEVRRRVERVRAPLRRLRSLPARARRLLGR